MTFWEQLKSNKNPLNLPNCLTLIRICLIPVIAVLLYYDGEQLPFERDWMFRYSPGRIAAIVVLIAGITDLMDGWLARRWRIESLLGKFLDPVADKVFLMVSLIMLMKLGRVEEWLVILLLMREFLITGLRTVAVGEGIVIAAGQGGKLKQLIQMIGVGLLMWYGSVFGLPGVDIGRYVLYVALLVSFISGYQYLGEFFSRR